MQGFGLRIGLVVLVLYCRLCDRCNESKCYGWVRIGLGLLVLVVCFRRCMADAMRVGVRIGASLA